MTTYEVREGRGRDIPLFIHSDIDDLGLTSDAFRVYAHLCRRANNNGDAWPSHTSIGEKCFRSELPNATKDSLRQKAFRAIQELLERGLIIQEARTSESGARTSNIYTIAPRSNWSETTPLSCHTTPPVVPHDTPLSSQTTPPVVPHDTKVLHSEVSPIEVSPIEVIPATQAKTLTPHQEMFGAICEALGYDYNALKPRSRADVGKTAALLRKAGYTVEDIRSFMVDIWFKDWRWTKNQQFPTTTSLCEEIGKLRSMVKDVAPKKEKKGMDRYREMAQELGLTYEQ